MDAFAIHVVDSVSTTATYTDDFDDGVVLRVLLELVECQCLLLYLALFFIFFVHDESFLIVRLCIISLRLFQTRVW